MANTSLGSALRIMGRRIAEEDRNACSDAQLLERFLGTADEAAFTTLVKRHGPMVESVWRLVAWFFLLSLGLAGVLATGLGSSAQRSEVGGQKSADQKPAATDAEKAAAGKQHRLDLFGDPLPEGALARLGTMRFRHGGQVTAVAISADRKIIASANQTNMLRLWELASGKPMGQLQCPQLVYTLAISPDGKLLAAGSWGGPVYLLNRADGRVVRKLTNPHNKFNAVAFSPDGKLLAAGSNLADGVVLWDVATGKLVRELIRERQDSVWSWSGPHALAFAPDGQTLATIFKSEIRLWNFQTGRLLHVLRANDRPISSLAFSGKGGLLASAGDDRAVFLWNWKEGRFLASMDPAGHSNSGYYALAFSPSGKTLAVATRYLDDDHSVVRLWDPTARKVVRHISWKAKPVFNPAHNTGINCLAFGSERTLLGGDIHGMVRAWDLSAADPPASKDGGGWNVPCRFQDQGHDEPIQGIAVSPDGKLAATAGSEATVRIWNARTGKEVKRLFTSRDVRNVTFSPDGQLLGAVDQNDWLWLWQTGTWKQVRLEKDFYARALAFSPDGKTLAIGGIGYRTQKWRGGAAVLVDRQTFREIRRFENISEQVLSVAFSGDGRFLATGASGVRSNGPMPPGGVKFDRNVIRLWDVASGREIIQLGGSKLWATRLSLSPDGRSLVAEGHEEFISSSNSEALSVWELATGQERARLEPAHGPIRAAAFSPDGNLLASAGWFDTTIRLWDLRTGKQVHALAGHASPVTGLAFATDAKTLVSSSEDATGLVWQIPALPGPKPPAVKESEWHELWQKLAGPDSRAAFAAVQTMKMHPRAAAAFLRTRLVLPGRPSAKDFERWLKDLNSATFRLRAGAEKDLVAAGDWAVPVVKAFLAGKITLEEQLRAKKILAHLEGPEHWRVSRAMEVLVHLKTPAARNLLETLARGPDELFLVQQAREALRTIGFN